MGQPPKGIGRIPISLNTTGQNAVLLGMVALRNSVGEALLLVPSAVLSGSTLAAAPQGAPQPSPAHLRCRGSPPARPVASLASTSTRSESSLASTSSRCYCTPRTSCTHTPHFVVVSKALLAFPCLAVSGRWRGARPVAGALSFPPRCCCPGWQSHRGGLGGSLPCRVCLGWAEPFAQALTSGPQRPACPRTVGEKPLVALGPEHPDDELGPCLGWLRFNTPCQNQAALPSMASCTALVVTTSQVLTAFGLKAELCRRST